MISFSQRDSRLFSLLRGLSPLPFILFLLFPSLSLLVLVSLGGLLGLNRASASLWSEGKEGELGSVGGILEEGLLFEGLWKPMEYDVTNHSLHESLQRVGKNS